MPNQTNNQAEHIRDFVFFGLVSLGCTVEAIMTPEWVIDLPSMIFGAALAGMLNAAARVVVTK